MEKNSKILVTGSKGLVGSAIIEKLKYEGFTELYSPSSKDLDLRDQTNVDRYFQILKPNYVFHVAGKVGGIIANMKLPAEFIYDNLMMVANIVKSSYKHSIKKLLFLGSSCIFPRSCPQPIKEEYLLSGPLEPTNEFYAVAKIAGIKLCQSYRRQYDCNFISGMPTNLYGPNDRFNDPNSHVIPALISRFHNAKINGDYNVEIWGTGSPLREFMHVNDLANACYFLMLTYNEEEHINIGTGVEISIKQLAETIRDIVYPEAELIWDTSKPDGIPRKILDSTKINKLGWKYQIDLKEGLKHTYKEFLWRIQALKENSQNN